MLAISRYLPSRIAALAVTGLVLYGLDRVVLSTAMATLRQNGLFSLWAFHTTIALLVWGLGALWAGVMWGAGRLRRPRGESGPPWVAGALLALAGMAPLRALASELVAGDWIAKQRFSRLLEIGGVVAGTLALFVLGWLYDHTRPREGIESTRDGVTPPDVGVTSPDVGVEGTPASPVSPVSRASRASMAVGVALLGGAIVASVADARVVPGLYPALHLAAYIACVVLTLLAMCRVADVALTRPRVSRVAGGLGGIALLSALAVLIFLLPARRGALTVGSRPAGLILPWFAPPTEVVADELASLSLRNDGTMKSEESRAASEKLLGGRHDYNVLLIIVDALRADALPPGRGDGVPFAQTSDTPFLNDWMRTSFRFRTAYSQASRTRRSLPPTFRGLEAHEDAERVGIPLGNQASALGMIPAAVVPQYFLLPEAEAVQHLLLGFDRATFYEKDHQEALFDQAHDMFEGLKGKRFFSWIHFYNMHDPYFADRLMQGHDGTVVQRYQKALRWLDAQMKRLWADLEASGLASSTIVIFTADHGEHVGLEGDRTGHGFGVSEAEMRVPLAVRIPGQVGHEIATIVGNVDILPTVLEIAGAPRSASHRGRSLLPVLAGVDDEVRPLYVENSSGRLQGVYLQTQKLIHEGEGAIFHRYDVASDPGEKKDLYDKTGEIDHRLRRAMLRKNPAQFASELQDAKVHRTLIARLAEVHADAHAGPSLELLVHLAALSKDPAAIEQGKRVFREARDPAVQLLVLRRLFDLDPPTWTRLLVDRVEQLGGTPDESTFVDGLATQGQAAFGHPVVAARLRDLAASSPEAWRPWLALIKSWEKPANLYAEPLETLMLTFPRGTRSPEQTRVIELLLESVTSLARSPMTRALEQRLAAATRSWSYDADPEVSLLAIRALGRLHDTTSSGPIRLRLDETAVDPRIRQALLYALADIDRTNATPDVVEQGADPLLTVDAIQILATLKDPAALPFLESIVKTHYNGYTRGEAKNAIKSISE